MEEGTEPAGEPVLHLERFEYIAATPSTALLRLSGRWRAPASWRPAQPTLLLREGPRTAAFEPLPIPGTSPAAAGRQTWRSAFGVPLARVHTGAFYLKPGAGHAIALPAPRDGSAHSGAAAPSDGPLRDRAAQLGAGLERLEERLVAFEQALRHDVAHRQAAVRTRLERGARGLDEAEDRLLDLRRKLRA